MAASLHPVLEEVMRSGKVYDEHGNPHNALPIGANRPQCKILQELVKKTNARVTLETGLAYGTSTLAICHQLASQDGVRHIAMDPFQASYWQNAGIKLVERAGLRSYVQFFEERSEYVLPTLCMQNIKVDFAYIDAHHVFDYALREFSYIDVLLRVGGIVVIDDLWMPAIQRVAAFIENNRAYRPVAKTRLAKHFFAAFEKLREDDRAWDHYTEF